MPVQPRVSVVVPVYNDARNLADCLAALQAAMIPGAELIVVDDASPDDSAAIARKVGARGIPIEPNSGPAAARNRGATVATGDVLFFVDADVVVAPDAVRRVADTLAATSDLAAVFGSYDDAPRAPGLISQYRNLLHHFVHQQGNPDASTFWAGCGAIRRSTFAQVGGFDEGAFGRAIEDIELGYRVRRAGQRILLDKRLLGTHLKAWTFTSLIRTDVMVRAIPWSRLIMARGIPNDLNLRTDQRLSAVLVLLVLAALLLAPLRPILIVPAALAFLAVATLNRTLYSFFLKRRGVRFTAAAILLHLLYYLYSTASYAWVWFGVRWKQLLAGGRA